MFTGIIEEMGEVVALEGGPDGARLRVRVGSLLADARVGESIAVSGVCLTIVETDGRTFSADLAAETLRRTTLGALRPGDRVNLERPLRLDQRLGGHIVQGHVDGVGTVAAVTPEGDGIWMEIEPPPSLLPYLVEKGSVAMDGVSLTVARLLEGGRFAVALIPHTLAVTTLGALRPGDRVNLEADILAKHVERLLEGVRGR
jgi:riboflavin synthase